MLIMTTSTASPLIPLASNSASVLEWPVLSIPALPYQLHGSTHFFNVVRIKNKLVQPMEHAQPDIVQAQQKIRSRLPVNPTNSTVLRC
ncbi:hypothetical protein BVRB_014690 [Beta vulgaris subsp. vulgaris]|uniref:Uncharacterized protein n=1 Tax=Beta vulgaris subsp. vulgaris TaxID=3555 RepID=A0A0J8B4R7_BETVV|nr:hypothetical protein BVRB_014690 [Beta vulgaris subsp. vulgaris]